MTDAILDPWMLAPDDGDDVLFGYAHHHPVLGGRAWTRSSPVVEIDAQESTARTHSGRHYKLRQQMTRADLLKHDEALAAYVLLVHDPHLSTDTLGWSAADKLLARDWLRCCKAARWIGIDPPAREPRAVDEWMAAHRKAYERARA
jgi:hypothetical protein